MTNLYEVSLLADLICDLGDGIFDQAYVQMNMIFNV